MEVSQNQRGRDCFQIEDMSSWFNEPKTRWADAQRKRNCHVRPDEWLLLNIPVINILRSIFQTWDRFVRYGDSLTGIWCGNVLTYGWTFVRANAGSSLFLFCFVFQIHNMVSLCLSSSTEYFYSYRVSIWKSLGVVIWLYRFSCGSERRSKSKYQYSRDVQYMRPFFK